MKRFKLVLLVASLTALLTAGIAIAERGGTAHTDTNGAAFELARQGGFKEATCAGEDGLYREFSATYRGSATSGDPRLNGTLTLSASGLINNTIDRGTVTGRWTLRTADGKRNAAGSVAAVYRMGVLYGVFVGTVGDPVGNPDEEFRGSGVLIANFQAAFPDAGAAMSGAFGGIGFDNRRPSAIQGGGCKGASDNDDD